MKLEIPIKKRTSLRRNAKKVMEQGYIPAVVYGPRLLSEPIMVDSGAFYRVYNKAGETNLVSLCFEDGKKELVLIKQPQRDVLTRQFTHIDFYQPPLDKQVEVTVSLDTIGSAPAVNEKGGVLMYSLHDVTIRALPQNLIDSITIDVSSLDELSSVLSIQDISVPKGVEILNDPSTVVAFIKAPLEQEPEQDDVDNMVTSEQDSIAEIKTEGEEKRDQDEEEET